MRVALGQIKKVDFALPLSGVTETVQVTAESPIIDVRQTSRQTNIRAEQVELLPKGRDFTTLVTQAPGANKEAKSAACRSTAPAPARTATSSTASRPRTCSGHLGQERLVDFVEEVQVKSSGYTAEFGGATGGVINAVTKSGTNDFHGNGALQLRRQLARARAVRRCDQPHQLECRGIHHLSERRPHPHRTRLRDRRPDLEEPLWFFGAYQPALTTIDRAVNPATAANPSASAATKEQKQQVQYITAT